MHKCKQRKVLMSLQHRSCSYQNCKKGCEHAGTCLAHTHIVLFADPFSDPDMEKRPNEDSFAKAATITVAIVGVGGSAVAGTAFALYKEVMVVMKASLYWLIASLYLAFKTGFFCFA